MAYQIGLFDIENRFERIKSLDIPLNKLKKHINFEFSRELLETHFNKSKDSSSGGRPPYDCVLMFKILILQQFYNYCHRNSILWPPFDL